MKMERPNSVKIAMCCLVASYVTASVQMLSQMRWSNLLPYVSWIPGFFVAWFLVFMIYRGKNWARWFYAGLTAAWLVMLAADIKRTTGPTGVNGALLILYLILGLTAALLLFTPTSNDWFRTQKIDLVFR